MAKRYEHRTDTTQMLLDDSTYMVQPPNSDQSWELTHVVKVDSDQAGTRFRLFWRRELPDEIVPLTEGE